MFLDGKMLLFPYICGQTPYKLKIPIFKVAQKQNWMSPLEITRKTGPENGMVCYVSMKTFRDIKDRNSIKSAESAKYTKFQLEISWEVFIEA